MLIKIVKLFGALCPLEPRLKKKLAPPIMDLISTTKAVSLLYECIHSVIVGGMIEDDDDVLAELCFEKLGWFIMEDQTDQNCKFTPLFFYLCSSEISRFIRPIKTPKNPTHRTSPV